MKMGKHGIVMLLVIAFVALSTTAGCARRGEEQKKQSHEAAAETAAAPGNLESAPGTSKPAAPEAGTPSPASASGKAEPVAKADKPASPASGTGHEQAAAVSAQKLPRLVDVGRGTCIPCKMMAPILEELKKEYSGVAIVEVIDLRYNTRAAMEYRIRVIPTQVFFDREGKEVWRHQGFMSKDAIIAKFKEMGVELSDS